MLKKISLVGSLLFVAVYGRAQSALASAPQPVPANLLTWKDCVQTAVLNNPDLQSALFAVASSRAQYRQSFNGILPKLLLEHTYSRNSASRSGVLDNGSTGVVTARSTNWQIDGSASLDLINVGEWASIQNASAQLEQSEAQAEVTAATALLNLYKAFTALMYAQEEVQMNASIRDTWKSNSQMVTLRYESGAESKGNKMNTQASYLQADANLAQAGRDVMIAQQQLGQAMGRDAFEVLVVTGSWAVPASPAIQPNFEAMIASEPAVRVQLAVVAQARAGITSARSTLFPTLSINYDKGRQGNSELPSDPFWTFSGNLTYPLFSNGLTWTYYAVQSAKRQYEKAEQDLRSIRNQNRSTLLSGWTGYAQAEDSLKVQKAFLDASRQRKGESDINYQSGLMTFENWILIVNDYVNSQIGFLRAEQSLILAEAQWRFAAGEQLGADTP